jgi:hypothetical protein
MCWLIEMKHRKLMVLQAPEVNNSDESREANSDTPPPTHTATASQSNAKRSPYLLPRIQSNRLEAKFRRERNVGICRDGHSTGVATTNSLSGLVPDPCTKSRLVI